MFLLIDPKTTSVITRCIQEAALRLPETNRLAYIDKAVRRELTEFRSLVRKVADLRDQAYADLEGLLQQLHVEDHKGAAVTITFRLSLGEGLQALQFLEGLDFESYHKTVAATTRADELRAVVDRYGLTLRDDRNIGPLFVELWFLRASLMAYRGAKGRLPGLDRAIAYLKEMFPLIKW